MAESATTHYRARQLARIKAGELPRIKIKSSNDETHWISISAEAFARIARILMEED